MEFHSKTFLSLIGKSCILLTAMLSGCFQNNEGIQSSRIKTDNGVEFYAGERWEYSIKYLRNNCASLFYGKRTIEVKKVENETAYVDIDEIIYPGSCSTFVGREGTSRIQSSKIWIDKYGEIKIFGIELDTVPITYGSFVTSAFFFDITSSISKPCLYLSDTLSCDIWTAMPDINGHMYQIKFSEKFGYLNYRSRLLVRPFYYDGSVPVNEALDTCEFRLEKFNGQVVYFDSLQFL